MAKMWSPEDEQGFGIREPDKDALTAEQQKALDDLRVETARDNQEYLHSHPEVKAMLSLLIRETLLQDRDVRTVAGEMFRSEKQVVAAVRRMMDMSPSQMPSKKRRSQEEEDARLSSEVLAREVNFSEETLRRAHRVEEEFAQFPDRPLRKRRDTPAPWIHHELDILTRVVARTQSLDKEREHYWTGDEGSPEDEDGRGVLPITWLQRELEKLTNMLEDQSKRASAHRAHSMPWMLTGKSSSQLHDALFGDDAEPEEAEEEEAVPLARRDTPAPWLGENNLILEKRERETYVLGLLERILEEPSANDAVFEKLDKIVEDTE